MLTGMVVIVGNSIAILPIVQILYMSLRNLEPQDRDRGHGPHRTPPSCPTPIIGSQV